MSLFADDDDDGMDAFFGKAKTEALVLMTS